MRFTIIDRFEDYPKDAKSEVFLTLDNWNDYSFFTLFGIFYIDRSLQKHDLGTIKIGYFGQRASERKLAIGDSFTQIGEEFFSLGVDIDYYEKLNEYGEVTKEEILKGLRDIARDPELYDKAILEEVTKVSFLRGISETTITGQFRRLAMGGSKLTSYHFVFIAPVVESGSPPVKLSFDVEPYTNPPTNIHILIGRNGVGKTYLINSMIDSLTKSRQSSAKMGRFDSLGDQKGQLFANVICVTFSAFDDFEHPPEQRDKSLGIQYSYIGLKEVQGEISNNPPKNPSLLAIEFAKSLIVCLHNSKINRWRRAISILESDPIFQTENIISVLDSRDEKNIKQFSIELFRKLSSGHKIVLLSITRLVETIQERSLILFDEPESHLHPPLLSSFIRALSDLLINRNGVAIIATHSPVILQEVPRACVWKLRRNGAEAIAERLEIESFGENVGVLTQEVFGLEVTDSGFHKILKELVRTTASYEMAVGLLNNQIGLEAKAILRSLFFHKANPNENNT